MEIVIEKIVKESVKINFTQTKCISRYGSMLRKFEDRYGQLFVTCISRHEDNPFTMAVRVANVGDLEILESNEPENMEITEFQFNNTMLTWMRNAIPFLNVSIK